MAVIEYSRNAMGIANAHTEEVAGKSPDNTLVIAYIPEDTQNLGGFML